MAKREPIIGTPDTNPQGVVPADSSTPTTSPAKPSGRGPKPITSWSLSKWSTTGKGAWAQQPVLTMNGTDYTFATPQEYVDNLNMLKGLGLGGPLDQFISQFASAIKEFTNPVPFAPQAGTQPPPSASPATTTPTKAPITKKPSNFSDSPQATDPYSDFKAAYQEAFGKPISQAELNSNDFLNRLVNTHVGVFRLLPLDRLVGLEAKSLSKLRNEDLLPVLTEIIRRDPSQLQSFSADRLSTFSTDVIGSLVTALDTMPSDTQLELDLRGVMEKAGATLPPNLNAGRKSPPLPPGADVPGIAFNPPTKPGTAQDLLRAGTDLSGLSEDDIRRIFPFGKSQADTGFASRNLLRSLGFDVDIGNPYVSFLEERLPDIYNVESARDILAGGKKLDIRSPSLLTERLRAGRGSAEDLINALVNFQSTTDRSQLTTEQRALLAQYTGAGSEADQLAFYQSATDLPAILRRAQTRYAASALERYRNKAPSIRSQSFLSFLNSGG